MSDIKSNEENGVTSTAVTENDSTDKAVANSAESELIQLTKKQLFYQKMAALSTCGIFVVILIAALIVVPMAVKTINKVNTLADSAGQTITKIDTMSTSITEASDNINTLVDGNAETLTKATKSLSEIDFEGLNQAISDLKDTVGPMAKFFSKFN